MSAMAVPGVGTATDEGERLGETGSVLLFAAQPLAGLAAEALRLTITPNVTVAETLSGCMEALRREQFDLIVLEESVGCLDPHAAEALYEAAGTSVTLEVNFGIMQAERIALSARAALHRRKLDLRRARSAAKIALQREFTAPLPGLLLESQLAVRQAGAGQAPALERLVALAEHVCALLRADDDRPL